MCLCSIIFNIFLKKSMVYYEKIKYLCENSYMYWEHFIGNMAHISGGIVGSVIGFALNKK